MATNYDIAFEDVWAMAGALRNAENNGHFPKELISKFTSGGEVFLIIQRFLAQYAGTGAVYITRDKHRKIYGISLIRVRHIGPALHKKQIPAAEFVRESGGIDEFCTRLWTRSSAGGLYRRAKTRYRCRKISAQPTHDSVVIDPEAGVPKNLEYDENSDAPQAQYQGIVF